MIEPLRIVIADDERPARKFLIKTLAAVPNVTVVGEATNGREAVDLIERHKPDLALLDLNMPEVDGLNVARMVKAGATPSIAFVTAYDDFAVPAFELNAIDYLLKPVELERLVKTIDRARAQLASSTAERVRGLTAAVTTLDVVSHRQHLQRIPVRRREETILLPVRQIASIVAEGELLQLTTTNNERFTITYRLHALEARLDPRRFVRLSRGALVAIDLIDKFNALPGGTLEVLLTNGQKLIASRIQSRILRETFLRL